MAFFSNTLVGYFNGTPMLGTLNGTVTRAGNNVTLNNLYLGLRATANVTGTKTFVFTLNGVANSLSIAAPTPATVLGTFGLTTVSFTVPSDVWRSQAIWSTSDGRSGQFAITYPVAPDTPTVTASTGFKSISVTYGTTSFGAPSSGTVSLYGGTSNNPTTVIDTYTQTGDKTFVMSGVLPSTTYYFRTRAFNGQKYSDYSSTVTATTQKDPKFLGSANGKAVRIKKLYCSVDGKTKNMKFYGSASGVTKRIF